MTIREYTDYVKKYPIKYNFGIGEDKSRTKFIYFLRVIKQILFSRKIKYSSSQGEIKLLQLIKKKEGKNYNELKESNIIITHGSTNGIFIKLLSLKNEIKEVLLFTPIYPLYTNICDYLNYKYTLYNLKMHNFKLNFEVFINALKDNINLVIINTPNNPTGICYSYEEVNKIVKYCLMKKIHIIIDQVYDYFSYNNYRQKLEINEYITYAKSFSKSYNLTGLRIGYLITDKKCIKELIKIQGMNILAVSTLIQDIAIMSIKNNSKKLFKKYLKNKVFLEKELTKNDIKYINMEGSFYCFININEYSHSAFTLAQDLLIKKRVNVLPGDLFLQEGFIRLSYACSFTYLKKGLKRIINYVNYIKSNR